MAATRLRSTRDGGSPSSSGPEAITRGTTNVFADLGFADAAERQTKLRLGHAINTIIEKRNFVEAEAARILRVDRPTLSALLRYKLERFSVERLMLFLTTLPRVDR